MAIVSVIALLAALGLAALLALQPWAADSVVPELSVAPGLGAALGDAAVVSTGRQLAVAPAQPVEGAAPRLVAGVAAGGEGEGESRPQLGLAAARVVAVPARSPAVPAQPAPAPPPAPPAPGPAPVPVSTSPPGPPPAPAPVVAGSGEAPGPVAAGGGPVEGGVAGVVSVCEGDEYVLSIPPGGTTEALPSEDLARHDLTLVFGSAGEGGGFYLVLFDGQLAEIGDEPVAGEAGEGCAPVDLGALLGESIEAGAEVHVEAVTIGEETEPAVP